MAPVIMGNPDRPELADELTASFCRVDPRVASTFARATFLSDNRADLPDVTVPTLVLQCADDPIAPDAVGAYVRDHVRDAELVRLSATGHCPNLSAPRETAAAIRGYLQKRAVQPD
jgi:sigma-B regulation protein RsbQ